MRKMLEFIEDPSNKFVALCMAIVKEPLRWLTLYFMRISMKYRNVEEVDPSAMPPLCDLVCESRSRVVVALRYYAWLLLSAGTAQRLTLFREGSVWCDWKREHEEQATRLRTVIIIAAMWTEVRHAGFNEAPLKYTQLADTRTPVSERVRLVTNFSGVPRSCRDRFKLFGSSNLEGF